jgi:hypothetical protein
VEFVSFRLQSRSVLDSCVANGGRTVSTWHVGTRQIRPGRSTGVGVRKNWTGQVLRGLRTTEQHFLGRSVRNTGVLAQAQDGLNL